MGGSHHSLTYHIVFATKGRTKMIEAKLRLALYPYLGAVIRGEGGRLLAIGGTMSHIHLLASLPPTASVSEILRRLKGNSSRWINSHKRCRGRFSWQRGYGAFSVSESAVKRVKAYIENQESHHKRRSFREEFFLLLQKHMIPYDERYIWE